MVWLPSLSSALVTVAAVIIPLSQAHSVGRNPIDYVTLLQEPVLISPAHRVHASSNFDITFYLHNFQQKIRLTLEPNHDILPETVRVRYLNADGTVTDAEPLDRRAHKVFRGRAYVQRPGRTGYRETGWARITVTRDGEDPVFEGAFQVDGDNHHVQTAKTYHQVKHASDPDIPLGDDLIVVWRDSDITPDGWRQGGGELRRDITSESSESNESAFGTSCASDSLGYNVRYNALDTRGAGSLHTMSAVSTRWLFGRQMDSQPGSAGSSQSLIATIGSTVGCPTARKVALMGVATDCTYTASFDSDQDVRSNIINQVNLASEVYERTFNISLGIQHLEISKRNCPESPSSDAPWNVPCSGGTTITDRLSLFSAWRGQRQDNNAYWTLLSTCNTGPAVGLAWLGKLCVNTASQESDGQMTSGANVVVRTPTEWQVIAHEIGHTFGATHDCNTDGCAVPTTGRSCCPFSSAKCDAGGGFIMNPSTKDGISDFSQCSVGNICGAMDVGSVKTDCLASNRDVATVTGSQCGNGIVETGEDCDCGGADSCGNNPCCDAKTCKFVGSAVCDPSNEECCTQQCQLASAGTVCRPSAGLCDPAETCAGNSPVCPSDAHTPDGDSCGGSNSGLTCASGQCTSRDMQCRETLGASVNDTGTSACDDTSTCQMCCMTPQRSGPQLVAGQNFVDGTRCKGDGVCSSGICDASIGSELGNWLNQNKNVVIPVASAVGGLLVIALAMCCLSMVRQRIRRSRAASRGFDRKPDTPSMGNSWENTYRGRGRGRGGVDDDGSRGGGGWDGGSPIPDPPPVASFGGGPPRNQYWPVRGEGQWSPPPRYA